MLLLNDKLDGAFTHAIFTFVIHPFTFLHLKHSSFPCKTQSFRQTQLGLDKRRKLFAIEEIPSSVSDYGRRGLFSQIKNIFSLNSSISTGRTIQNACVSPQDSQLAAEIQEQTESSKIQSEIPI
ncbi:hypothetical protein V8G54_032070 [Vigna mungo]|uniref:Uncharacterized protein n=1 Tax=Vigna mungo TaxID=3915 RepID=A0AAQ3RHI3_VIGMU